ncbi:MAG: hypothetical protein EAZ24_11090 [Burkholderiales bacterium]|nr:MAG: hypothetical protein EAZ24_11090 [Burkholderiales bacterium]TAG81390.1 MAG: hypothetical protein EAZ21_06045 [Betaproteobacteria bacterium]
MNRMRSTKTNKEIPIKKIPASVGSNINARDAVLNRNTDELVIALCGPIGSALHNVATAISEDLTSRFGYEKVSVIRLSELIEQNTAPQAHLEGFSQHDAANDSAIDGGKVPSGEFVRIEKLIRQGNALRARYTPSFLAELAIRTIRLDRQQYKNEKSHDGIEPRRVCHIIDSIKNDEELKLLRDVYGEMPYVVGVFSPLREREESLIARGMTMPEIHDLIDTDSGEEKQFGQTVRKTFPQSDYFLRLEKRTQTLLKSKVGRFLDLVFGATIVTPSHAESAMYAAAAAGGASACLSRQVGAAITDSDGNIVSTGWNDVPKYLGGLYGDFAVDSQHKDHRCWNFGGKCFNHEEKDKLAEFLANTLIDAKLLSRDSFQSTFSAIRENAKLSSLIEFSRSVHAEMHAILNAGRQHGRSMIGGSLFVTTYPCHSCARHIIAAGIKDVYYIEPYKKSLATKLHGDSITELEDIKDKVRLLPYEGVAPHRFLNLFLAPEDARKTRDGKLVRITPKALHPRNQQTVEAFHELESRVLSAVESKLRALPLEGGNGPKAA